VVPVHVLILELIPFSGNPVITAANGAPDGRDPTTLWTPDGGVTWYVAYGIVDEAIVYKV
jgi:hypothetical protein